MLDLLLIILAAYTLTDILVNRGLPFGVMDAVRQRTQWQVFNCFYCSAFWSGIVVYGISQVDMRIIVPLAGTGGAILLWRYTGSNQL